jgi:hypothetical protein
MIWLPADSGIYPATDIEFRYQLEERGAKRIPHHQLVLFRRSSGENLGAVELHNEHRFNFAALRQLAPAALADYQRRAR